jgi:hypothetical protein
VALHLGTRLRTSSWSGGGGGSPLQRLSELARRAGRRCPPVPQRPSSTRFDSVSVAGGRFRGRDSVGHVMFAPLTPPGRGCRSRHGCRGGPARAAFGRRGFCTCRAERAHLSATSAARRCVVRDGHEHAAPAVVAPRALSIPAWRRARLESLGGARAMGVGCQVEPGAGYLRERLLSASASRFPASGGAAVERLLSLERGHGPLGRADSTSCGRRSSWARWTCRTVPSPSRSHRRRDASQRIGGALTSWAVAACATRWPRCCA